MRTNHRHITLWCCLGIQDIPAIWKKSDVIITAKHLRSANYIVCLHAHYTLVLVNE